MDISSETALLCIIVWTFVRCVEIKPGWIDICTILSIRSSPATGLNYFHGRTTDAAAFQLVQNLRQEESVNGVSVVAAGRWLSTLEA